MVHLKKSPSSRRSYHNSGLKRSAIVLLIVVAGASVLGLFWFLSQFGPKKIDYSVPTADVELSVEVYALRGESLELEAQFEEVLAMRPAEAQDMLLLKRALNLQRQYVEALPGHNAEALQHFKDLEQRYQNLSAERLRVKSAVSESEAQSLAQEDVYEAARDKYLEALETQDAINENFPLSSAYNIGRATRLQRQARYLNAEPLLLQSLDFEREADAYIAKNEWNSAAALLQQAIEIQQQLNREYRGTTQASGSRLEDLKVKWVGIESGQDHLEIEEVLNLADASRAEDETLKAASLYGEVARLQKQLNKAYPDSPFASSERVVEFRRKSQTAQSADLGLEIERNHDLLKRLLGERRTYEAAEVIVALRRDIKHMQNAFPDSSLNDEELAVKVRYLNLVQSDLGYIQGRVYNALLPVPETAGLRMLRTEVPQALYVLMMGTNPSRNRGDLNPVDSVSWTEAKSFCERLSWILGKEIRLPSENEFRQALGRLRYVVLEEHVWSSLDADGVAQPVGKKAPFASGFYDLLGNVSEWLESGDRFDSEKVRHIGGHAQDRLELIFSVPVRSAARAERNRLTGFRVVMIVD